MAAECHYWRKRAPVELCLNVQPPLCGRQDFITHVAVTLQSPVVHTREHSDVGIDVIIYFDDTLVIVKPMEPSHVLLKRAFPRNRHRQEQRVESSIVKPLTYVAASCQDQALLAIPDVGESLANRPALLPAHSSLEHDDISNLARKSSLQSAEMISSACQNER
jgi:hypothetical protein